jgi:hypothetical protein
MPLPILPADIGAYERPDPSRIRQGHIREVENEALRAVRSNHRLKAEHVRQGEWPGQAEYPDTLTGSLQIFDCEWFVRHRAMLIADESESIKATLISIDPAVTNVPR